MLVGVVPERPGVRRDPAVDVVLTGLDRVLGHPGDAVLGVGHVDPVPVQGDAVLHVLVVQAHLDELADSRLDERSRRCSVQRVAVDGLPRRELDLALAGRQVDHDVGLARGVGVEVVDAHGRAHVRGRPGVVLPPVVRAMLWLRGLRRRSSSPISITEYDEGSRLSHHIQPSGPTIARVRTSPTASRTRDRVTVP